MNALKSTSIRKQILYITYAFTSIVGLIIALVSYVMFQRYYQNSLLNAARTNLSYLADSMDNGLYSIDQLELYCQSNSVIASYVNSDTYSAKKRLAAYDVLSEYCQNNAYSKYLHRVVITAPSKSYIQTVAAAYSTTEDIAAVLPSLYFFDDLSMDSFHYNYGFINDPFYKAHEKPVLPVLKPITYKYNADIGGYIFIEISQELFTDALQIYHQDPSAILLLTLGSHHYIYEQGSLKELHGEFRPEKNNTAWHTAQNVTRVKSSSGESYLAISEPLSHGTCSVTQLITKRQFLSGMGAFIPVIFLILAMLVLVTLILNRLLNRTITEPVHEIQKRLEKIASGDFSRDTSIEWNHELGDIGTRVNDLAENLKKLLDSSIAAEKEKRDLEYKVLQSQVNPHFLYNTLNSIKWMALTQGATGISEMTTALSRLLKSISKGTRLFITLEMEFSLLMDYFTIQQYRYGQTLQMDVELPESLKNCLIIKFTLQPLVENAIFHGIEPTGRAGIIQISVFAPNEKDLKIAVHDNGVGMTADTIAHILNDDAAASSDFFREFGVRNIQKRLEYEYGKPYGIEIDSVPGEYTTMTVTIPKETER